MGHGFRPREQRMDIDVGLAAAFAKALLSGGGRSTTAHNRRSYLQMEEKSVLNGRRDNGDFPRISGESLSFFFTY